jgi:hypothetical protein
MRRITVGLAASLYFGCSSSEEAKAPAEVEVFVDGDQAVMDRLVRVRASVHALDALAMWQPLEQTEFVLAKQTPPAKGEVRAPFSFGISQGATERFELAVEGFTSLDPAAMPVIERKVLVTFRHGQRVRVDVMLDEACYELIKPCSGLMATCQPESRACGPAEEATYDDPSRESSPMGRRKDDEGKTETAACPADHGCPADYPCMVTAPDSYTCVGQMADWPMPIAGSKVPHQYDFTSDPRVVVDQATGLVWQRDLPQTFTGCTLANRTAGDLCTWDEAKNYCAGLDLAGRRWRLPTKIELESIIDTSQGPPTLVEPAFPPLRTIVFWTASIDPKFYSSQGNVTKAWNVNFFMGNSGFADPLTPGAARCVSNGVFKVRGTPQDRYQVDMQAGTVTDRRTGLTWRRAPSGSVLATLADAERYCTNLGDGFRVPAQKEMLTLFDPTAASPSIHDVFVDPPNSFAWAVVARADGGVDEWYLDHYGSSYPKDRYDTIRDRVDPPHVRCVR